MKRREFLKSTVAGGAMIGSLCSCKTGSGKTGRKPNIVLIMADDLGVETIGCYGAKDYKTPHIDKLAAEGVRFNHCYAQPLCTPSRVQIMTGRYNHRNYEGFGYLNPREITFANLLKGARYRTCVAGKWQLSGDAGTVKDFGFDEHCLWNMHAYKEDTPDAKEPDTWLNRYDSPTLFVNGKWTEHSKGFYGPQICADFVTSFIERNADQPFFVYYPMILPHGPFVPTPRSADKHSENKKQNFVDMVEYMDRLVGRIVQQLKKQGVLDNTLILFTGDNGTHQDLMSDTKRGLVRGGKSQMTDAGTRVPLVASWPGRSPRGKVLDDLVDFSDFLPTLSEAAGAKTPNDRTIDGLTFLPQLLGKRGKPRKWVFCHYWEYGRKKENTRQFVRNQRWKLYDDGRFYDIENDPLEKAPLTPSSDEAEAARKRLRIALSAIN